MADKIREQIAELQDSGTVGIGINHAAADSLQSLLDENERLKAALTDCESAWSNDCMDKLQRIELLEEVVDAVTGGVPSQIIIALNKLRDSND